MKYTFKGFLDGKIMIKSEPHEDARFRQMCEAAGLGRTDVEFDPCILANRLPKYVRDGKVCTAWMPNDRPTVPFADIAPAPAHTPIKKGEWYRVEPEDWGAFAREAEAAGFKWSAGQKPTEWRPSELNNGPVAIHAWCDGDITWSADPTREGCINYVPTPPAAPVDTKIIILFDGDATEASMIVGNRTVATGRAHRNPSDPYDLATGARLALDRLLGKEDSPAPAHMYSHDEVKALKPGAQVWLQNRIRAGGDEHIYAAGGRLYVTDAGHAHKAPWEVCDRAYQYMFVLWDKEPTKEQQEAVKWR